MPNTLDTQLICQDVLAEKYFKGTESSVDEIFERVATALASVEKHSVRKKYAKLFLENMEAGGIGAGRIMSSAGTDIKATLINCFVQPVGDCIQGFDHNGLPGIYEALREAAETMRRGGGVGYDFSAIRPRGAIVNGTRSTSSGPCPYIDVFDKSCSTVESAGSRRGAQMGVMRIDHPDVMEFITAKRTPGRWNNFNVSVGVTDEFMAALAKDAEWDLIHAAEPGPSVSGRKRSDGVWVYSTVRAKDLWDTIMKSTYDFAEPGILFLDNIRRDNNLNYCESINATNPCGEQPLPAYGCCDLGPIILTKFVSNPFGIEGNPSFDFKKFAKVVETQVRMLDNVLDVTFWPLQEQQDEAMAKRRIGVGYTGLGNTLCMLKLKYNSEEGRAVARLITETMRDAAYEASVELAKQKGAFHLFHADDYLAEGNFASRLPFSIKDKIRKHGIRNSHLLSIAPTGTVSLAFADNASNGIEPPFSWTYTRNKREADGSRSSYTVEDHAWRLYKHLGGDVNNLPEYFVSALEMSAQDHVRMMEVVQPFIDTAISKTVNIPADYPFEEFKNLYLQAHKANLKGLATYRPNNTLGAVLEVTEAKKAAPPQDLSKLVVERRPNVPLQALSDKLEYWTEDGKRTLYLIVSFITVDDGTGNTQERAIEFFTPIGQSEESQQWMTSSMRMLSLAARGGFLEKALSDMRKVSWDKGAIRFGMRTKPDGTSVPLWHSSEVALIAYAIERLITHRAEGKDKTAELIDVPSPSSEPVPATQVMSGKKCPDCGAHSLIKKDGCSYCTSCGYLGSCG